MAALTRKNKKSKSENESVQEVANPLDPIADEGIVVDNPPNPMADEGKVEEAEAGVKPKAESESVDTPIISNAAGVISSTPKYDGDDDDNDEEVADEEGEEEEKLEPYDSFTMAGTDSLNYQRLEDNSQSQGRKGRFSGKDLLKFIPSTSNKYCLVI